MGSINGWNQGMFSSTTYTAGKTQVKAVRQSQRRIARIELEGGVNFNVTESCLPMQIGRERDCDITIPNGHVSRHHCELFMANGVLCLKDSSSNGKLVPYRCPQKTHVCPA